MKLPAIQFYPGDWHKDQGVQSLDLTQRGAWFELLLMMHDSDERGVLLVNGQPMPDPVIARRLGLSKDEAITIVETLITYGVASRREDGALMCRRMVRDEIKRSAQSEHGKKGGNPALCQNYNVPGFLYVVQRASDGWVKIGISSDPSRRLYKLRYQRKGDSLELLASIRVDDMGKREAELHHRYKHRASGEWFALNAEELETLISTLKGKSKTDVRPSFSSSTSITSSTHTPPTPAAEVCVLAEGSKKNEGPIAGEELPAEGSPASASHTGGGAADVATHVEFRPDPEWAPQMRLVAEQMIAYWQIAQHQHAGRRALTHFCRVLFEAGQGETLQQQFQAYRSYKELTGEQRHGWNAFIGKESENYQDVTAGWLSKNWVAALAEARQNPKYHASSQHRIGGGPAASAGRATTLDRDAYTGRRPTAPAAAA